MKIGSLLLLKSYLKNVFLVPYRCVDCCDTTVCWGSASLSQSQLLKCWLKPKRKGGASALTVKQAEASLVYNVVKAIAVSYVFIEEDE